MKVYGFDDSDVVRGELQAANGIATTYIFPKHLCVRLAGSIFQPALLMPKKLCWREWRRKVPIRN